MAKLAIQIILSSPPGLLPLRFPVSLQLEASSGVSFVSVSVSLRIIQVLRVCKLYLPSCGTGTN